MDAGDGALPPAILSESRIRARLDAALDAIITVDTSGRIVLVNAQAEMLFGFDRAELLGQPIEILLPTRFHASHLGDRAGYLAHPLTRPMGSGLELAGRRKDGTEFPVEISLSPLGDPGPDLLTTALVRDVTDRQRIERALRIRARLLDLADNAIFVRDFATRRITALNQGTTRLYQWATLAVRDRAWAFRRASCPASSAGFFAGRTSPTAFRARGSAWLAHTRSSRYTAAHSTSRARKGSGQRSP